MKSTPPEYNFDNHIGWKSEIPGGMAHYYISLPQRSSVLSLCGRQWPREALSDEKPVSRCERCEHHLATIQPFISNPGGRRTQSKKDRYAKRNRK